MAGEIDGKDSVGAYNDNPRAKAWSGYASVSCKYGIV